MARDVKQPVTFNARPGVIFEMLMDARQHQAFTGAPGGKSKLVFTQAGAPRSALKGITQGWKSHYWDAMKAYIKAAN